MNAFTNESGVVLVTDAMGAQLCFPEWVAL